MDGGRRDNKLWMANSPRGAGLRVDPGRPDSQGEGISHLVTLLFTMSSGTRVSARRRQLLAALLGTTTAFLMACMALSAQMAVLHGSTATINLIARGIVGWICSLTLLQVRQVPAARDDYIGPRHAWHLLILRCVVGTTALALFLAGLEVLPLGDCTALFLTNQFWTCLLAKAFLGESLRSSHALGIALGLPGALLIVQPPALFGAPDAASNSPVAFDSRQPPALAPLLPLGAAVGAAGAYISIQACGKAGVPKSAIVHCFTLGSAILGACASLNGDWRTLQTASPTCLGFLLLCGFLGYIAQVCLTAAISLDSASTVAIAMLSEVLFAYILGAMVSGTQPSAVTLGGAILLTAGAFFTTVLPDVPTGSLGRGDRKPGTTKGFFGLSASKDSLSARNARFEPLEIIE